MTGQQIAVMRQALEERIYETVIQWDEGGGKRSRRELARRITALTASLEQPATPQGWKLVPVEPTKEMCRAGYMAQDKWPNHMCDNQRELHLSFSEPRWKAMLNAAPTPPKD